MAKHVINRERRCDFCGMSAYQILQDKIDDCPAVGGITKADIAFALKQPLPPFQQTPIFIRPWEIEDIKLFEIRGEHPYHFGVSYCYRPYPFICS